ncbi:hypothetical protein D3C87_1250290 [compost metagenome]
MAHAPFLIKSPKIGSNNPKSKTVSTALPKRIFKPKPIGNITINGATIIRAGSVNSKFKPKL